MTDKEFKQIKMSELLKHVRHHRQVLAKASQVRILEDSELKFMGALELYDLGILTDENLREEAFIYFRT